MEVEKRIYRVGEILNLEIMENDVYLIGKNGKIIILIVIVIISGIVIIEVKLFLFDGIIINKGNLINGIGLIIDRLMGIDIELNNLIIRIEINILLLKVFELVWGSCFENLEINYYFFGSI